MLWDLFCTFLRIGFVSFGGGYAMIPIIDFEVTRHGWMTTKEFTEIIAVAGMSPGPIATNSAIIVGYKTAGMNGAVISALGMTLPTLFIILLVSSVFFRYHQTKLVKSAFYGLRPIITGLIIYAAIRFALSNHVIGSFSWHTLGLLSICGLSLLALIKYRIHPIAVILVSGLAGVVLWG
ncbi:chromate transporter [Neobacillus kokaensis]|uniref:Chromate transporter n=1 Tax=Neobacillus kokaensis TaxID=2759023 RepID=A0ABQ3N9J0_9BACI|nr:chromate transporter [Neobacillus kokaensis]GHI00399.1 chromate transporter [Neobacillus kokaensis]